MPARRRTPTRKASAKNIENWQRKTVAILLRLRPDMAEALRSRAAAEEMPLSRYVERLIATDLAIV